MLGKLPALKEIYGDSLISRVNNPGEAGRQGGREMPYPSKALCFNSFQGHTAGIDRRTAARSCRTV